MITDSNDKTTFPLKLLLTDREVSRLHKDFAKNSSANIKLSKTQLLKKMQSGGFLGSLLGPLLKTGLPLLKNVLKPLVKNVLIQLGLTTAASAADPGIRKKDSQIDINNINNSNTEMDDIIKIVKGLEKSGCW